MPRMREVEHFTAFRRPSKSYGEPGSPEVLVDVTGYRSAADQIGELLAAGVRLKEFRSEYYDVQVNEEVDLRMMDPTREPNFDMADGHTLAMAAADRIAERQKVFREKQKAERKAAVEERVAKEVAEEKTPPKKAKAKAEAAEGAPEADINT